jgi:hypothetical protein
LNDHVLCGTVGTDSNVFIDVFNGTSWSGFQPIGNIISISDPPTGRGGGTSTSSWERRRGTHSIQRVRMI